MAERRGGISGCVPPMDLFRSEPMQLVQLIIPIESARLSVAYLGDLGLIQFKDVRALLFIHKYQCLSLIDSSELSLISGARVFAGVSAQF